MKKQELINIAEKLGESKRPFFLMVVPEDFEEAIFAVGGPPTHIMGMLDDLFNARPDIEQLVKGVMTARIVEEQKLRVAVQAEKQKGRPN